MHQCQISKRQMYINLAAYWLVATLHRSPYHHRQLLVSAVNAPSDEVESCPHDGSMLWAHLQKCCQETAPSGVLFAPFASSYRLAGFAIGDVGFGLYGGRPHGIRPWARRGRASSCAANFCNPAEALGKAPWCRADGLRCQCQAALLAPAAGHTLSAEGANPS